MLVSLVGLYHSRQWSNLLLFTGLKRWTTMNKRTSESEIRNRGNIPVSLRRRRRYAGATGKEEAARETATDGLMEWGQRKVKHMARSDTWRRRCMWHCFKKHRRYESASDIRDLWCAIHLVWLIDYWLHTVFVSVLSLASRFGHTPFSCRLRFVCNDVIHKTYRDVARGGPRHGHRQHASKIW